MRDNQIDDDYILYILLQRVGDLKQNISEFCIPSFIILRNISDSVENSIFLGIDVWFLDFPISFHMACTENQYFLPLRLHFESYDVVSQ